MKEKIDSCTEDTRRIKDNAHDKGETKLMGENEKWVDVNECALKAETDVSVCP